MANKNIVIQQSPTTTSSFITQSSSTSRTTSFDVIVGDTYYVRVADYNADSASNFVLKTVFDPRIQIGVNYNLTLQANDALNNTTATTIAQSTAQTKTITAKVVKDQVYYVRVSPYSLEHNGNFALTLRLTPENTGTVEVVTGTNSVSYNLAAQQNSSYTVSPTNIITATNAADVGIAFQAEGGEAYYFRVGSNERLGYGEFDLVLDQTATPLELNVVPNIIPGDGRSLALAQWNGVNTRAIKLYVGNTQDPLLLETGEQTVIGPYTTTGTVTLRAVDVDRPSVVSTATLVLSDQGLVTHTLIPRRALIVNRRVDNFKPVRITSGNTNLQYRISPTLPRGLMIGAETGEIAGVPLELSPWIEYSITVTDSYGATVVSQCMISVVSLKPISSTASFATTSVSVFSNVGVMQPTKTSNGWGERRYSINPALPLGLHYDALFGEISGIPQTVTSSTQYTVTVTDNTGVTTSSFSLQVSSISTVVISPSVTLISGQAITPFAPVASSGGTAPPVEISK